LHVEAQFAIRQVTSNVDRYYLVMAALTEAQTEIVSGVADANPTEETYERVKAALISARAMTPFQQVDQLMAMEPLNGRRPSEMMSAMLKLRPPQDEYFFAWAFLQRLPREVRILLAHEEHLDLKKLAEKADHLMALHKPQLHDVAAVSAGPPEAAAEDDTVAAATGKGKFSRGGKKNAKKGGQARRRRSPSPFDIHQSPLCYYHVRFGDKAHKCIEPCAWPGN
jgi:hypothetical protein